MFKKMELLESIAYLITQLNFWSDREIAQGGGEISFCKIVLGSNFTKTATLPRTNDCNQAGL